MGKKMMHCLEQWGDKRMMHCLEQGGDRVVSVVFPTKADQILSKYRPIAPKLEEDFGSCSTITVDVGASGQQLVNGSKNKRSRKRSATSGFPCRAVTRLCVRSTFDKDCNLCQATMLPAMRATQDFEQGGMGAKSGYGSASETSYPGYNSHSLGLARGLSAGSNNIGSVSGNPLIATGVGALKAVWRDTEGLGSQACCITAKDDAFMERAAQRASSTVRSIIYSGISATNTSPRSMGYTRGSFSSCLPALVPTLLGHGNAEEEEKEVSSEEEQSSPRSKKDLITLSLFPQDPLRSTEFPVLSSDVEYAENCEADAPTLTQLRLCATGESYGGEEDVSPPAVIARDGIENKIDAAILDRMYMATEDAVMLVSEADQVLWSNTAFKKAVAQRLSQKNQYAHDVFGLPIYLACYTFQPSPGAPDCEATLLGFSKKLVSHREDHLEQQALLGLPNALPAYFVDELNAAPGSKSIAPIAAPPVKAIASTVSLECVTEVLPAFFPTMILKLGQAKDQLEQSRLPAVVADGMRRVRWVNTAYRMMVGQQECLWLATTLSNGSSSASESLAGEVKIVCSNDQPPLTAAAFSCIASVFWSNADINRSVTVPCDVSKLVDDDDQSFFAWKFHITAANLREECVPQTSSYPCANFNDTSILKFRRIEGSISHASSECMTPCSQRVYSY